jgi:nitrogen regulatory protein P-II 1
MKLVIALIAPDRTNDAIGALHRVGVRGYTMSRVQVHDGESEHVQRYRGTTARMLFSPRMRFEVAVPDVLVDATIAALRESEPAGERGDVFVLDLERVAPTRGDHRAAGSLAPAA